jgi:AmmeMemoRadiSam system protein B
MMRQSAAIASVRPPAVAGYFYPSAADDLRAAVRQLLAAGPEPAHRGRIKALIVPHAGYVYSGTVAARAFRELTHDAPQIEKVVLVGPAHRVAVDGIAVPTVEAFRTPLGDLPIDAAMRAAILDLPGTRLDDRAHEAEHCLEVELPFLQNLFDSISVLPLLVGRADPGQVARILERLWGGPETLIVVSSDLSHYHDYATAQRVDAATARSILARSTELHPEDACGAAAINGLMLAAGQHGLDVVEIARLNSGDTAGDRQRVVGYGSYALCDA